MWHFNAVSRRKKRIKLKKYKTKFFFYKEFFKKSSVNLFLINRNIHILVRNIHIEDLVELATGSMQETMGNHSI